MSTPAETREAVAAELDRWIQAGDDVGFESVTALLTALIQRAADLRAPVSSSEDTPARVWQEGDKAIWHDEDNEARRVLVLRTHGAVVVRDLDIGSVTTVESDELSEVPAGGEPA